MQSPYVKCSQIMPKPSFNIISRENEAFKLFLMFVNSVESGIGYGGDTIQLEVTSICYIFAYNYTKQDKKGIPVLHIYCTKCGTTRNKLILTLFCV